ncbi:hypothetical protein [Dyadobacter sp. 3J3]|uniref:hypothetical protein n=1 Tax=Dyadobacter sp. 3J3 TaxID=2606600 RepID=UPI00135B1984|nr:hypothetical protein [Dyadobacter sp. 3J3]
MIPERPFIAFFIGVILMLNGTTCSVDRSEMESFKKVSSSYAILAEKSLDVMADFDLETWGTMLSDSVVYYFPDRNERTTNKLTGKSALLAWWSNYIAVSGIKSMTIENAHYVPICIEKKGKKGELPGIQVIAYFSNNIIYEKGSVSVKMKFIIHFDENKLIDGYQTYYDTSRIVNMQKDKNIAGKLTPDFRLKLNTLFPEYNI